MWVLWFAKCVVYDYFFIVDFISHWNSVIEWKKNPFILSRYPDITNKAKTSHEKRLGQLQVSGNPFERCIIDGWI